MTHSIDGIPMEQPMPDIQADRPFYAEDENGVLRRWLPPTRQQPRYTLATDIGGIDYVVPLERLDEWHRWVNAGSLLPAPAYAMRADGTLSFETPSIRYGAKTS